VWIGFNEGIGTFDTLIKWWTRGPFSHTELIFSNGDRHTSIPGKGTMWLSAIEMEDSAPEPRKQWITIMVDANEERVRAWCNEHVFDQYDWPGIFFSQILPMKSQARSRYWCTEANVEALQYGDCPLLTRVDSRMMNPNKLYRQVTS
jgi:hypothetical protein